jgi:hypothetical protein
LLFTAMLREASQMRFIAARSSSANTAAAAEAWAFRQIGLSAADASRRSF